MIPFDRDRQFRLIVTDFGLGPESPVTLRNLRSRSNGMNAWLVLVPPLDDAALEARLFRAADIVAAGHAAPDFAHIHQELKRKGVTLTLLWEKYSAAQPGLRLPLQPVLLALRGLS